MLLLRSSHTELSYAVNARFHDDVLSFLLSNHRSINSIRTLLHVVYLSYLGLVELPFMFPLLITLS